MRSVTVFPASLMRLTMSEWDLLVMEHAFTARMRSPTFSFPQRSAGLPSMMRPILWGMATHALPAMVTIDTWRVIRRVCVCFVAGCCWVVCGERGKRKGKGAKEQRKRTRRFRVNSTASQANVTERSWSALRQSKMQALAKERGIFQCAPQRNKRIAHTVILSTFLVKWFFKLSTVETELHI